MHIDTKPSLELSSDHPIDRKLTADEAGLYWSAAETMIEAVEVLSAYKKQNEKIDPEDPELAESIESLQDSILLCELIEDAAISRVAEGSSSKTNSRESNSSDPRSEPDGNLEGRDE